MEQRYWVRLLPRGVCPQPEGGAPCLAVLLEPQEAAVRSALRVPASGGGAVCGGVGLSLDHTLVSAEVPVSPWTQLQG